MTFIVHVIDIMCVVRDTVDPLVDEKLADFVVGSHQKAHPFYDDGDAEDDGSEGDGDGDTRMEHSGDKKTQLQDGKISQDLLRKYILYAKRYCQPKLSNIDEHKISQLYSDLRR